MARGKREDEAQRHRTRAKKYFLTENEKLVRPPKKFKNA